MKQYFICFVESHQTTERLYQDGEVIKVDEIEIFKWIQKSHDNHDLKIYIYSCKILCDLS